MTSEAIPEIEIALEMEELSGCGGHKSDERDSYRVFQNCFRRAYKREHFEGDIIGIEPE